MSAKRSHKAVDKPEVANPSERRKKQKKDPPSFSEPGALVTFLVGKDPDPVKFLVHREYACYRSPILDAAFNSYFIEGQTQTYRLDDVNERVFRFFVQYLYHEKLVIKQLGSRDELDDDLCEQEDLDLFELWMLADKFRMPRLQNLIMESIERIVDAGGEAQLPSSSVFRLVHDIAPADSALRRYVSAALSTVNRTWLKAHPEDYTQEMLFDLAVLMRTKADKLIQDHEYKYTFNAIPYKDFHVEIREDDPY